MQQHDRAPAAPQTGPRTWRESLYCRPVNAGILQRRHLRLGVEIHQPRQVHRPVRRETPARDSISKFVRRRSTISSSAELSISSRTASPFAPVVQLFAHAFEHASRLSPPACTGCCCASRGRRPAKHLVAPKHLLDLRFDQLMQKDEVRPAVSRWAGMISAASYAAPSPPPGWLAASSRP